MSFPYTLSKKLDFRNSDYWIDDLPSNFNQLFIEALKSKDYTFEDDFFSSRHSLFSIPFKFEIDSTKEDDFLRIKYNLHLQNLVNGIIVIILLSAFFSRFEFGTFLWSSFLLGLAFYQLSLWIINTGIKKQLYQILSAYKKVKDESDIEYWVTENNRNCPACGAILNNQTLFCPDCGLKIRQNAYSKPLTLDMGVVDETMVKPDRSEEKNTNQPSVNFEYKKKKDT